MDGALALLMAYLLYAWFSERRLDGFMFAAPGAWHGGAGAHQRERRGARAGGAGGCVLGRIGRGKEDARGVKTALLRLAAPVGAFALAKASWSAVVAMQGLTAGGSGSLAARLSSLLEPWPEARGALPWRAF